MSSHEIKYDAQQNKLTVRNCTSFPMEVLAYPDTEILDMSFGHMISLPDEICRLHKMRIAFFSSHDFTEIPSVLSDCEALEMVGFKSCQISKIPDRSLPPKLRGLILTDNQLSSLPSLIGKYTKLQKLMLSGNHLQTLSKEILSCEDLQLLRLSINDLPKSPDWLFQLPRLAWYSDTGNPFHTSRVSLGDITEIPWNEVQICEKIGESTKNIVYKAILKNGREVAVKVFGSGITTDGLPVDDINACLLAGEHQHIIGGLGKTSNSVDGIQGLIMPLISERFKVLGKPPDFKTLTRDTYPDIANLPLVRIRKILHDISSAMQHCHHKGIMHGDIYAHNILSDPEGHSYLGDFGAASLYPPNTAGGELRQGVDVRGFSYLITDLISNCPKEMGKPLMVKLQKLEEACSDWKVSNRPSFREIHSELE